MNNQAIPRFVSIVAIALGMYDLVRGFIHTIMLEYAAANIAGLDLATAQGADLLQIMSIFGSSNFLTGIMLIILGWKLRPFALAMLGFIPLTYAIGISSLIYYREPYAPSQAEWGGAPIMRIYLLLSIVTFVVGLILTWWRSRSPNPTMQRVSAQ